MTGVPGVGKTTLIREVARRLAPYHPAGFYTEELRDQRGVREGFRVVTLCGRHGILSHVRHAGPPRVGRYGVDLVGFEGVLKELDLLHSSAPLIFIDEIGKMECCSQRFVELLVDLLDGGTTVVATIALRGKGFIEQVKHRPNCQLIIVTRDNRDALVDDLTGRLQQQLRRHDGSGAD